MTTKQQDAVEKDTRPEKGSKAPSMEELVAVSATTEEVLQEVQKMEPKVFELAVERVRGRKLQERVQELAERVVMQVDKG